MLNLRAELAALFDGPLPAACRLPRHWRIVATPEHTHCECSGSRLRVQWTDRRWPVGIAMGAPVLYAQTKRCPVCKRIYRCEWIDQLIPPHGLYAYDLIVEVGRCRFLHHRQQIEITARLHREWGLCLPAGSIHQLCDHFLDYLLAVHESRAEAVAELITRAGGYMLALDGTCEAGTKNLFMAIDALTKLVLVSESMTAENVSDIKQVVDRAVKLFGLPLATIRDLSKHVAGGRAHLPGHVKDLVCQYHFLENVGGKLSGELHAKLTKRINALNFRPKLRGLRTDLLRYSRDRQSITQAQFKELLDRPETVVDLDPVQLRRAIGYFVLRWLDDYAVELKGEYFPFDQPSLAFYRRCVSLSQFLRSHLPGDRHLAPTLHTIAATIAAALNDPELIQAAKRLEKAVALFEELRHALRFQTAAHQPLRRQSSPPASAQDMLRSEQQLIHLRESLRHRVCHDADAETREDAETVLSYLDAYWDNLHGHVVTVSGSNTVLLAPRTNAAAEQRFGITKRGWRRRLGTEKLARQLQGSRAEEMLVGNLANPSYVNAVYGGTLRNMPARFAASHPGVSNKRQERKTASDKAVIPVGRKTVRMPTVFSKIGRVIAKMAACLA